MATPPVTRSQTRLQLDPRRIITKPYVPESDGAGGNARVNRLVHRVLALSPSEVTATLAELRDRFGERHIDLDEVFTRGFLAVAHLVPDVAGLPDDLRKLIGAYFVHEYSLEGAALTNPSIVPDLDQSDVPIGSLRVIISLRAVGEGHISSIEFRTGVVGPTGEVNVAAAEFVSHRHSISRCSRPSSPRWARLTISSTVCWSVSTTDSPRPTSTRHLPT